MTPKLVREMTDAVAVAIVSGSFSFLAALLSFLEWRLSHRTSRKVTKLEENTNGNLERILDNKRALRELATEAAYNRGIIEGQRKVKEEEPR